MDAIDVVEELDKFSRKRTAYSGTALALYLAAVALSQSMLVAVAGGFALLVVRSWAIDRMLMSNGMQNDEMQRAMVRIAREDAEQTRAVLTRIRRECARPRRRVASDEN